MPVRSFGSPVLCWPDREAVVAALTTWSARLRDSRSDVLRVGYFGSYARGDWGVGSDLDVVIVVDESDEAPLCRPLGFDTITGFATPVDLLVYTAEEWHTLEAGTGSFARRLITEVVWVT